MVSGTQPLPPAWYRVVAALAVAWMLFGLFALSQDLGGNEAMRAQMSDVERQLYDSRPTWLIGAYAVAVLAGLIGAIGLVMRRLWAVPALALSLVAAIVQFVYTFTAMRAIELLGPAVALPFPIVILSIGVGLLMIGRTARARGWLS